MESVKEAVVKICRRKRIMEVYWKLSGDNIMSFPQFFQDFVIYIYIYYLLAFKDGLHIVVISFFHSKQIFLLILFQTHDFKSFLKKSPPSCMCFTLHTPGLIFAWE